MAKKLKYIFLLIAFFSSCDLFGQVPEGYFRDVKYMDNGDTLYLNRYYGEWWFGLFAGPNIDLFFGDLFSREHPQAGDEVPNRKISFNSTFGGGYYFGAIGEYRPINQHWSYSLGLSILDRKVFSSLSTKMNDSLKTQFEYKSVMDYFIISPGVKYFSKLTGFYYYGTIDIGIPWGSNTKQRRRFENSGDIEYFLIIPNVKSNIRAELNLGVGYEFFLVDFNSNARIIGNPYVSLNAGSNIISHLNSSWNAIGFKLGFALKYGRDRITTEIFPFDATYQEPVRQVAQLETRGVEFPGFTHSAPLPPVWLAMVPEPVIEEEVAEVEEAQFSEELQQRTGQGQIRTRVVPNQLSMFTFDKPETTTLSPDVQQYLDLLSDYLKTNTNTEVRITGHSDSQGSLPENTQRANARANNAKAYLMKKGIPSSRVLTLGRGSLIPVAPNDTPANQRKNRRIEVIVVGK